MSDSPLRSRPYAWLLAGRTVDSIGNAVTPIALGFAALDLFGSVTALGLVVGASSLGNVLLLLAGGVVADRLPRSVVLLWSNVVAGVAQLLMAWLVVSDVASVPLLAAVGFVTGAAAAFDYPATTALVPQTVPPSALRRASAMLRLSLTGSWIVAAPVGGLLVALIGPGPVLAVDALTFLAAAACYAMVRVPIVRGDDHDASPLEQLAAGWREFRSRTWVWVIVSAFFVINAAWSGGIHVLGVDVADRTVGRAGWGVVLGAQAAGVAMGAVVAGRWRSSRPLATGTAASCLAVLLLITLARAPQMRLLVPAAVLAGLGISLFAVSWDTALAQHIPTDRLARVASFDALGSFAAIPLGKTVVGPIAEATSPSVVLTGCATVVVVAVAATLACGQVRRLPAAVVP